MDPKNATEIIQYYVGLISQRTTDPIIVSHLLEISAQAKILKIQSGKDAQIIKNIAKQAANNSQAIGNLYDKIEKVIN